MSRASVRAWLAGTVGPACTPAFADILPTMPKGDEPLVESGGLVVMDMAQNDSRITMGGAGTREVQHVLSCWIGVSDPDEVAATEALDALVQGFVYRLRVAVPQAGQPIKLTDSAAVPPEVSYIKGIPEIRTRPDMDQMLSVSGYEGMVQASVLVDVAVTEQVSYYQQSGQWVSA